MPRTRGPASTLLRGVLLGGRPGPLPARLVLALGASVLAAGFGLLVLTSGTPLAGTGAIEAVVFGGAAALLLAVGWWRRRRGPPASPEGLRPT